MSNSHLERIRGSFVAAMHGALNARRPFTLLIIVPGCDLRWGPFEHCSTFELFTKEN